MQSSRGFTGVLRFCAAMQQVSACYLQDVAAAAGLRSLEKRIETVPVAVHEFLQGGGVPAAVTILVSEPIQAQLRDVTVSLLTIVLRKQPQAAAKAFL